MRSEGGVCDVRVGVMDGVFGIHTCTYTYTYTHICIVHKPCQWLIAAMHFLENEQIGRGHRRMGRRGHRRMGRREIG